MDVVVPTYNNRELVQRCIASLVDSAVASIVVVDDVSTDDTVEALQRDTPEALVVTLSEHLGLSHAVNEGAARGDAPYILFLNDDVIATDGSISCSSWTS